VPVTDRFDPKYVTFDCYGTLINFAMSQTTRDILGDRLRPEIADEFIDFFRGYRIDEVLDPWKPYRDVIVNAYRRAAERAGLEFRQEDAEAVYEAIPSWGPHPDVPGGLSRLAERVPLVILTNAMDDQLQHNVARLGAPFHKVFTAQQAQAYKPRLAAFQYMLDQLGVGPDDIVHVSSSFRYDLMPAYDLHIRNKVWVNRGHEPSNPYYGYREIASVEELPGLFGI
jgi:2-haloacid dehalogenase